MYVHALTMPTRPNSQVTNRTPALARRLSVLLVGLQLLGLGHLAFDRHGICWEHGKLTELDSGGVAVSLGSEVASGSGATANEPAGLHRGGPAAIGDADTDRHCPVQASRRNWANPAAPAGLAQPALPQLRILAFVEFSVRTDDALLLRAPKQSPPTNT
jgi:hypothetical protein